MECSGEEGLVAAQDAGQGLPEEQLRALLPRTWHAFFGRFGRLRPIQRVAIPDIVSGRCVLVQAPTATGKTEALMAPLVERLLSQPPSPQVGGLVIAPTRALCNDLRRRLAAPLQRCGLSFAVKTADSKEAARSSLARILITTPESLDSLLARRAGELRSLQWLFLDELHLLSTVAR
ncbi:MAG: DEAD/DEAH box helicase, partial [Myxococcota bacterium]|nr:DEAD/DEAH box helicase [Myxococcota bacterium]